MNENITADIECSFKLKDRLKMLFYRTVNLHLSNVTLKITDNRKGVK